MTRLRIASTAVGTLLLGLVMTAPAHAGPQGCVVTNPPNPAYPNPCGARQGTDWVYAAGGDWEIKLEYADGRVDRLSSSSGAPDSGTLPKGAYPTAKAVTPGSFVIMGDPSPLAADGSDPKPVPYPRYEVEDDRVARSSDGTPIVYRLLVPEGVSARSPAPAAIAGHGWGGDRHIEPSWDYATRMLLNAGYVVLMFDSRGFGQSGGQVEIDHVDHEGRDVRALVDVLADDPRVQQERRGDPRVGMYGSSYGGGVQYVAAATDARIDAIAPLDSWNDLVEAVRPEGQLRAGFMSTLTAVGAGYAAVPGLLPGPAGTQTGSLNPMLSRFLAEAAAGAVSPAAEWWMRDRGPWNVLDRVRVPTLIGAGQQDTLFPPSQALATHRALARRLRGERLRMLWYCGGHGTCKPSYFAALAQWDRLPEEVVRWFDRWVRDDRQVSFPGRFSYMTQDGAWHDAPRYRPNPRRSVTTAWDAGALVVAHGEPTAGGGTDVVNFLPLAGAGIPLHSTPTGQPKRMGVTTAKFTLPDVAGTIVGRPRLTLAASATGAGTEAIPLYFRLVDARTHEVLANQETVKAFRTDGERRTVQVRLEPLAWRGSPEQQLALEVTSSSLNFEPSQVAGAVSLENVALRLPLAP